MYAARHKAALRGLGRTGGGKCVACIPCIRSSSSLSGDGVPPVNQAPGPAVPGYSQASAPGPMYNRPPGPPSYNQAPVSPMGQYPGPGNQQTPGNPQSQFNQAPPPPGHQQFNQAPPHYNQPPIAGRPPYNQPPGPGRPPYNQPPGPYNQGPGNPQFNQGYNGPPGPGNPQFNQGYNGPPGPANPQFNQGYNGPPGPGNQQFNPGYNRPPGPGNPQFNQGYNRPPAPGNPQFNSQGYNRPPGPGNQQFNPGYNRPPGPGNPHYNQAQAPYNPAAQGPPRGGAPMYNRPPYRPPATRSSLGRLGPDVKLKPGEDPVEACLKSFGGEEEMRKAFEAWVIEYRKEYESPEDKEYRYGCWKETAVKIHSYVPERQATLARLNHYADYTLRALLQNVPQQNGPNVPPAKQLAG